MNEIEYNKVFLIFAKRNIDIYRIDVRENEIDYIMYLIPIIWQLFGLFFFDLSNFIYYKM